MPIVFVVRAILIVLPFPTLTTAELVVSFIQPIAQPVPELTALSPMLPLFSLMLLIIFMRF